MVSAVVSGIFVDLLFLLVLAVLMVGSFFVTHGLMRHEMRELPIVGITLFFSMLGIAVGVRFIKLMLVEAFDRECQLREQVESSEAARRDAERGLTASQHFAVLGRVASGVAHDMNNVLTVVYSTSDLLMMGLPEAQARSCLQDMKRIAEEMAVSTKELLSYVPKSRCVPRLVCPSEVVERMGRTLRRVLPDRIGLSVQVSGKRAVLMDPSDLQRVLLNLVVNARDAMPGGGRILIKVEERVSSAGEPLICIEISDTGEGISPEVMKRLFEPFFTTKPAGKGTGLGLKMVRQMVEESGGTVEVRSEVGHGSCFTLHLPAREAPKVKETFPVPKGTGSGGRVFVLLQKPELRDLSMRILERGGFTVDVLPAGADPLRFLREGAAHDMMLLDAEYSGAPLGEVFACFRERRATAGVLVLLGTLPTEELTGILSKELVASIERPFSANELLKRVEELIG